MGATATQGRSVSSHATSDCPAGERSSAVPCLAGISLPTAISDLRGLLTQALLDKMHFTLSLEQHGSVAAVPVSMPHQIVQQPRPPLVVRVEVHMPASVLTRGKLTPRAGPAAVMVFNALTPHSTTIGPADSPDAIPGSLEATVLAAYQPAVQDEDGAGSFGQIIDGSSFR